MKSKFKKIFISNLYIVSMFGTFYSLSLGFSNVLEDRDSIILNELEKYKNDTSKVILSFQDYKFENPDEWNTYSKMHDSRASRNSYSTIFRLINDVEFNVNALSFNANLCDITHYDDIYYNTGNVKLLYSDGTDFSKLFEDNAIYINMHYADVLKGTYGISEYNDLLNKTINLKISETQETFSIKGIYNEKETVRNRCFNKLYDENFGNTFFISRSKMNDYSGGVGYIITGLDKNQNSGIFDFIKGRFKSNINFPNCILNEQYLIRDVQLSTFKETKKIKSALSINPYIFIVIGCVLLMVTLCLNKYLSKIIVNLFKKNGRKYYISFFTYLIILMVCSLGFYYVSTKFNFIYKGNYVFENKISNWAYFIVTVIMAFSFLLSLLKKRLFDFYNSKINQSFDFLKQDITYKQYDSFIQQNTNNKTAVVFTRGVDPNSAGGQRSINDALTLKALGYDVWLCGFASTKLAAEKIGDLKVIKWDLYNGKNLIKRYISYMTKKHILNSIKAINAKIDLILIYSVISISQVKAINKYATKNNVTLIYDSVEFQNFFEQYFFSFFTYYIPNMYINKHAITKKNYVIAISKYLEDYYKQKNIYTVRLPFINRYSYEYDELKSNDFESKIVFAYTGKPGKKDDLFGIIKSYSDLNEEELEKSVLLIAGPDAKTLYKIGLPINLINKVKKYIIFLGMLPYIKMKNIYSICDFTVLLKKSTARHAKADFPSKVSQSLANGIPVISNVSSDLEEFLIDDYNSILFPEYSYGEMTNAFRRALNKNKNEIIELKKNALETSKQKLSFNEGITCFNNIVNAIDNK